MYKRQEEYMNKSASLAFYCGMITTALVTLICFFAGSQAGNTALLTGFASGWGVSVAVHGFSVGYYKFRESWVAASAVSYTHLDVYKRQGLTGG